MAIPRWKIVFENKVGVYHCMVRCVRQAYLCGDDQYTGKNYDHRKEWIRSRLVKLAGAFGVDVLGYAVMSNHLHVILRTRPDRVGDWHGKEVARRWLDVYTPKHMGADGVEYGITDGDISLIVKSEWRLQEIRKRLSSVSWFMKALNEHIARRANLEEGCKGRFWESRFRCQRIDGEGALLACMCYVDLNPVRAEMAESLEDYDFTAIYDRIMVDKARKRLDLLKDLRGDKNQRFLSEEGLLLEFLRVRRLLNRGRFLVELDGKDGAFTHISSGDYYRIVDATGRLLRRDKAGVIGADVRSLLESLNLDADEWLHTVQKYRKRFGAVAGTRDAMIASARCVGQKWWKGIRAVERVYISREEESVFC